jgi:hypothetical protein
LTICYTSALARTPGQRRGCQRASNIGPGKSGAAQAPARISSVALRLHVGTSRTSFRSRISAHGGQGGRGREIHLSRSFPHAAARMRVQARQRRPRHSRHPGLSRAPPSLSRISISSTSPTSSATSSIALFQFLRKFYLERQACAQHSIFCFSARG